MKKPNLFIVGEPKSGTTALHGFLDQHPQIAMSRIKEPYHFCTDFHEESDLFHGKKKYFTYRDMKKYLRIFDLNDKNKVVGESSTFYMYSKVAAENIYTFNKNAKIIIFLRNPVDFLYSLHSHWLVETYEDVDDFRDALQIEPVRKTDWKKIPPRVYFPSMVYYSSFIRYAEQVQRFYDYFSKDQVKIILFEDFKNDNKSTFKEILKFLEVDTSFCPEFVSVNASKKPRNKTMNYIAQNVFFVKMMKNILPYSVHKKVKNIGQKVLWKKAQRIPLDAAYRSQLVGKYKRHVHDVSDVLGIDMVKKWDGY